TSSPVPPTVMQTLAARLARPPSKCPTSSPSLVPWARPASIRNASSWLLTATSPTAMPLLFFFQAADGIRYRNVTGVQTCALPILQDNGIVNKLLMWLGIVDDPLTLINSLTGVVIGMVYIMLPFMILPMHTTMNSIDRNLLQAAGNLGAAPWKAFLRVFLPLSLPGVGTGAIIVFVMTLGYYIIPALLGGTNEIMLGEFIADQIQSHLNWGIGTTAGAVLVVITLVFFVIYLKVNEPETKEE